MTLADVTIIGGGPAGLFAAEILSAAGRGVTLYERKPTPARKFLLAGRGGLNLTHSESLEKFIPRYREAAGFMQDRLQDFTPADMRAWCEGLGQPTFIGSSGRVFPESLKAAPLLRAWLKRLTESGVQFKYDHAWKGWDDKGALLFHTGNGAVEIIKSQAILLALGGASWPRLGSDGAWAQILRDKDIEIAPLRPANCGFEIAWSPFFADKFAGLPLKNITLHFRQTTVRGEIMIDKKGIEGGAIYMLSSRLREALADCSPQNLAIDLRPDITLDILVGKLSKPRGRNSFSTWLQKSAGLIPPAIALLREVRPDVQGLPVSELAYLIKSALLPLTRPFPIERAISSAGGIALRELDDTLMLKKMPGVFAAGEMLDWEAPTGGYLLQGCFATAHRAAHGILSR